jgi:GDPmannose 4,6-dehydratase
MTRAIIVGCDGQDGRLLRDHLVRTGCDVIGVGRRTLDIGDPAAVRAFVASVAPVEIYYLPAVHHSSQELTQTDDLALFRDSFAVHVTGLIHFLEAAAGARLFYAASSHVFGDDPPSPQDETTPFAPSCIYGITKAAGVHTCRYYRARGVFAATGILYNHESALRRPAFVSQKIVQAARRIRDGSGETLELGTLAAAVDWGYAPDFVDAFHRILQLDRPDDFVVATGETHTVGEFAQLAFATLGLDWTAHVTERPGLLGKRVVTRVGNAAKLTGATGWRPSVSFARMIELLVGDTHGA